MTQLSDGAYLAIVFLVVFAVFYCLLALSNFLDRFDERLRHFRVRRYSRTHEVFDWRRHEVYLSIGTHVRIVREQQSKRRGAA